MSVANSFGAGDSCFRDSSPERSPAPPNQTMLSGFGDGLAATLKRISPTISTTCASAISKTFPQKRPPGVLYFCEGGTSAILLGFCFGGDADLRGSRALQCVHHSD